MLNHVWVSKLWLEEATGDPEPEYLPCLAQSEDKPLQKSEAHVDITGPNPVEDNQGTDDDYWNHMANIRRAILLRPVLQRHVRIEKKEQIEVQESVLNALLKTRKFYHGSRSLEAVLAMGAASRYKETGD
ncbi:hypothetical protein APSETT444_000024 [Aspergillus pseudonomiae]